MGISFSEFAKRLGVSVSTVSRAVKRGRLSTLPDGTLDWKTAKRDWERNRTRPRNDGSTGARVETDPEVAQLHRKLAVGRAAREALQAQMLQVKLQHATGELVRAADVKADAFSCGRRTRDAILAVPDRIAPILAATDDAAEVRKLLRAELVTALGELAGGDS